MKIAFLVVKNIARGGGIEKYTLELGSRLVRRGHEVTVYSMAHYGEVPSTYCGMRIVPVWSLRTACMQKLSASAAAAWKVLRNGSYDVVHFHAAAAGAFAFLTRRRGHACVLQMHGIEWQRSRWGAFGSRVLKALERIALPQYHAHTAVSRTQCCYYHDRYDCPMVYIPTATDVKETPPAREVKRLGLEPSEYVLFASRLVHEKGAHHLIRAFRGLQTDMKLVIAGDAQGGDQYKRGLRELAGGDRRIVFPGFVEGRTLAELFGHAYVYVQPSRLEGLSIALLEAMSYGRCCLVSDIPENVEALGDCGYTFESEDAEHLRYRLQWLIDDWPAVLSMEQRAVERVRRHYSWDAVAAQMERLYQQALNGQTVSGRSRRQRHMRDYAEAQNDA